MHLLGKDLTVKSKGNLLVDETEPKQSGEIALPVRWRIPKGVQSRYANTILVRAGLYEVLLAFFEVQWPDIGEVEPIESVKALHVECVSKIIVRPEFIPNLIALLETRPESNLPLETVPPLADWTLSDLVQGRYANIMLVQSGQYEVIASFFEGELPFIFGSPEEIKKNIENLESISAVCVGKINMPPQLLPVFIQELKVGLKNYHRLNELYHKGG